MSGLSISEGLQLPPIGLGCMSLPEGFAAAREIIDRAIDLGITFFDTADLYQKGKNEENLGKALQGRRKDVILATKVGNQWNPDSKSWSWNPSQAHILQGAEDSLKRLQTDYIDLYQLHGGTIADPWDEIFEAFEMLKAQGKIRAFGISSIRPNVIRKVMAMNPPATILMQYSPLDRRPEEEVFPALEGTGTRVLARGAFAKGILIDKPAENFLDLPAQRVAEIKVEIGSSGFSPEAVLIRYGLSERAVSSLVIGASSTEQIEKLTRGLEESRSIPAAFIAELKARFPANHYQDHR
jgi:aryl-alcohol dehydrogenase-like predicted oxidoreductase